MKITQRVLFILQLSWLFLPIVLSSKPAPSTLTVIIVRHGEKPANGDNLSCQGLNRALALPEVLYSKFGKPDFTFIPAIATGKQTGHSRMFQTVTPMAVQYNLTLDSKFDEKDFAGVAESVLKKTGTVLLVWEHSAIPGVATALGVKGQLSWADDDFDSIWIIKVSKAGVVLTKDKEGLHPSPNCK
jgi:hypothetical protein